MHEPRRSDSVSLAAVLDAAVQSSRLSTTQAHQPASKEHNASEMTPFARSTISCLVVVMTILAFDNAMSLDEGCPGRLRRAVHTTVAGPGKRFGSVASTLDGPALQSTEATQMLAALLGGGGLDCKCRPDGAGHRVDVHPRKVVTGASHPQRARLMYILTYPLRVRDPCKAPGPGGPKNSQPRTLSRLSRGPQRPRRQSAAPHVVTLPPHTQAYQRSCDSDGHGPLRLAS